MKKINSKGFTLIELLAVITILGILMLVAIPAVSRTIENSRRDTFADNTLNYIQTVRNAVLADELKCTGYNKVSGTPDGTYYFTINTDGDSDTEDLMEKVAKSPWGGSEVSGYVAWKKDNGKTTYYAFLSDGANHGMFKEQEEKDIKRAAVVANITKQEKCGAAGNTACSAATATSIPTAKVGTTAPIKCTIDK